MTNATITPVILCDSSVPGVICGGAEDHRFLVAEAMQAAKIKGQIILEPLARK